MIGGLPFGQSMNQRQVTAAGHCCLYVWNVVGERTVRYPAVKSGMCFSTHLMNETASPLSD